MPLQMVTPPVLEPVSLDEVKHHLRVDIEDDDALITALITAARQAAESITQRQLMPATHRLVLDGFVRPQGRAFGGCASMLPSDVLLLTPCPVRQVNTVQYLDMNGAVQSLSPNDYVVDLACEPARVSPAFGRMWPAALPQIGSVSVSFDTGYADKESVPEGIKAWIKLRVGAMYAHREEITATTRGRLDSLPFVDGLLDPYKLALV
jgi:uncharacterized phiE125 gp8 family phage protein